MNEAMLEQALLHIFDQQDAADVISDVTENRVELTDRHTFADEMLLTPDNGLVLRFSDGTEFQVTIRQSR